MPSISESTAAPIRSDAASVPEKRQRTVRSVGAQARIKELIAEIKILKRERMEMESVLALADQELTQFKTKEAERGSELEKQAAAAQKVEDDRRLFLWKAFIDLAMRTGVRPKYQNFDQRVEAAHIFISTDLLNELLQFPLCCEMTYGLSADHEACKRLSRLPIREAIRWLCRLSIDIEQKLLFLQSGEASHQERVM